MQLPPPIHGASVMNENIRNSHLISQNFQCDYVNLGTSEDQSRIGKKDLNKYLKVIYILYKIFVKLRKKDFDLAYLTLFPFGIAFIKDSLSVILLKLFDIKIIYHFHSKGFKAHYENSGYFLRKYQDFILKNTYLIHLSPLLIYDIPENENIKKRFIVPNGIEIYNYKQDISKRKKKEFVEILYLSNLIEEKGVLVALQAIAIVNKRFRNIRLNIIGDFRDESLKYKCHKFIEDNKLNKYIKFKGSKYGDEKFNEFENSDFFIFPTYYKKEAFPLVILEAMQFGLPVISTLEGGIPDMVKDGVTGFLIPQKDPKSLADRIEKLLNNDDLKISMGEAGKREFFEKYTLKSFEERLYNVFKEII